MAESTTQMYGVDVSSNNSASTNNYVNFGSNIVIVKLTEGTSYKNPSAATQIATAKASGQVPYGYFWAIFSGDSFLAKLNAEYAVSTAKQLGLPAGSFIATDWEKGDGNITTGNTVANTQAILTSMRVVKDAGYRPMLYSGAYVLRTNVNTSLILKEFPNSLWVASYPRSGAVNEPDFNYFPSMDGIAIWQFTDNWQGARVDGNIAVIDLASNDNGDDEMNWHPGVQYDQLGIVKINNSNGADLYEDSTLTKKVGHRDYGTSFKISRAKNGAVCAGTNQWFSQADVLTKINPLSVNSSAPAIFRLTSNEAWTQNEPNAAAKGIKKHYKGETFKVFGRTGQYLKVGSEQDGKYFDGTKGQIIL